MPLYYEFTTHFLTSSDTVLSTSWFLRSSASCVTVWFLYMRASCVTRNYIVKEPREKITSIYLFHGFSLDFFLVITCRNQVQNTWKLRFVSCVTSTWYDIIFYLYNCAQYFLFFFLVFFIFSNPKGKVNIHYSIIILLLLR